MSSFCDFIQVYVFTTNHHLKGSDYYKTWWLDLVRYKILGLVPLLFFLSVNVAGKCFRTTWCVRILIGLLIADL